MLVSPRERTQQAMALRASTPCSCSLGRLGSAMTQPVALPGSLPVATPSRLRPEASAASVLFWRNSNPVPPLVSSQAKLTPSWSAKALPAAQSACGSSNLAPAPTRDIIALEASAREARPSAGAQRRAGPRAQGGAAPSARSELPLSLRAANEEALQASRERQELFDSISPVYDLVRKRAPTLAHPLQASSVLSTQRWGKAGPNEEAWKLNALPLCGAVLLDASPGSLRQMSRGLWFLFLAIVLLLPCRVRCSLRWSFGSSTMPSAWACTGFGRE